jgi:Tfp pilus assembly protein PilF
VNVAMQLFRRALQADSSYVLSHLALGNAHMRSQQISEALANYRRGLLFEPTNARLLRNAAMAQQLLDAKKQGKVP